MVIGLTGTNGAGKTAVGTYLKTRGFRFHSLSDEIRKQLNSQTQVATRKKLIETGNRLRTEYGPAVLAERIKSKLAPDQNYVIDSIRNPYEVECLRGTGNFYLLRIDAPVSVRYERVRQRGGPRTPKSLQEFISQEKLETEGNNPIHQQLKACFKIADATLINDSDFDKLGEKLSDLLKGWLMAETRPDWDEYFMGIARIVSLRSNCIKRKVAAVIVQDKRIISTGYNGTPRKVKNCNEGGCPRCSSMAESGSRLGECLCSHAEENAIVQAAYHGISVKGSTLYSTFSPCLMCTKMIINSGIREVVYNLSYTLENIPQTLMLEADVNCRQFKFE